MNSEMHSPGTSFAANIEALRTGDQDVADAVADLRLQLTDEEMLWLLDGDLALWRGFAGMADLNAPLGIGFPFAQATDHRHGKQADQATGKSG